MTDRQAAVEKARAAGMAARRLLVGMPGTWELALCDSIDELSALVEAQREPDDAPEG